MSVKNYQVAEGEGAAEKIEDELWNIIVMKYYYYEILLSKIDYEIESWKDSLHE